MEHIFYLFGVFFGASPLATVATVFIFDVPRDLLALGALGLSRLRGNAPIHAEPLDGGKASGVTVVIASLNDAEGVLISLNSLKAQDVTPDRIIVFSDGSTDHSVAVLSALKRKGAIDVLVINDQRISRAAAGNLALQYVGTEFVLFIDCDTHLEKGAIGALRKRLLDRPAAAACSGNIGVRNERASIWTSLQKLEYMIAIDFGREFSDTFGAVACCSGALTMYRTCILTGIGGFSSGSGEDLATTLKLRRLGHEVHFESEAWAYTNAPETLRGLVSQRLRWDRDAFRIQIVQFKQIQKQGRDEPLSNTLQRYDFLLFTFLPTLMLPMFVPVLAQVPLAQLGDFLVGGYLFLILWATVILAPVFIFYRGQVSLFDLLLLPIFPLYQGIFMKMVRLYAYITEAIFHASANDGYLPRRFRKRIEGKR